MPVALFVAFTAAPGTTAPDGSVTVPLIAPRYVCALAGMPTKNRNSITTKNFFILSVLPLSSFYKWTDRCCPGSRCWSESKCVGAIAERRSEFRNLLETEARGFATTHAHIRPWVIRPQLRGGWNESATLPRFRECCACWRGKSKLNNASPEFRNSMRSSVIERTKEDCFSKATDS